MAKTTNKDIEVLKDAPANKESKETKGKKIKVRFIDMVRASYGAYDAGDVAELDKAIADDLIAKKVCEEVKE